MEMKFEITVPPVMYSRSKKNGMTTLVLPTKERILDILTKGRPGRGKLNERGGKTGFLPGMITIRQVKP